MDVHCGPNGPERCTLCGTFVELLPVGMSHNTPWGCIPNVIDMRFAQLGLPEEGSVIMPILCWPCRGRVLDRMPRFGRS